MLDPPIAELRAGGQPPASPVAELASPSQVTRLRQIFATELIKNGGDMRDAQFALGHAVHRSATTQRYVGFTEVKRLRELMETNPIRIEHGGRDLRLGASPNTGKGVPPFGCVGSQRRQSSAAHTRRQFLYVGSMTKIREFVS